LRPKWPYAAVFFMMALVDAKENGKRKEMREVNTTPGESTAAIVFFQVILYENVP